jgi:nitrite reductase/ring-hydroxylating ferredoxin subunit
MNCNQNRRNFIKNAGLMVGAGILTVTATSFVTSCEKDQVLAPPPKENITIDLTRYPALLSANGMLIVTLVDANGKPLVNKTGKKYNNGNPIAIMRDAANNFTVLDTYCPHQGCLIPLPSAIGDNMVCPCHQWEFSSKTGALVKGTSGTLTKYDATLNGTNLVIFIS